MKQRKRELAKVGIFGSIDNPTIVTEKDLKEITETFPDIKKAPVKLGGHWTEDRPRLANVVSVEYDEKTKTLSGIIEEQDALADAVDGGFYPDVSIGAKARASDGKMYLHHLAYLGDEPPAIKDLEESLQANLTQAETESLAASDKGGVKLFPGTTEKRLYLTDSEPNPNNKGLGTERNPAECASSAGTPSVHQTPKEQSMTQAEITALQTENERLKAENAEQEKLLSDTAKAAVEAQKKALQKAIEGKVPQDAQPKLLALCDSFVQGKSIELSDSAGNKTAASPIAVLTEVFSALPLPVQAGVLNLSDGGERPKEKNLSASMMAAL